MPEWDKYKRMAYHLANQAKSLSKAPVDTGDLVGEIAVAFVEACSSYDPSRGQFSTHFYWQARKHLRTYLYREYRQQRIKEKLEAQRTRLLHNFL